MLRMRDSIRTIIAGINNLGFVVEYALAAAPKDPRRIHVRQQKFAAGLDSPRLAFDINYVLPSAYGRASRLRRSLSFILP
jgi:hypothetical protein